MYPVIKSLSAAELGFIIVTVGDVQLAITERYRSIFVQIEKATEIKHRVGVMLHNRMCFPYLMRRSFKIHSYRIMPQKVGSLILIHFVGNK